MPGPDDKPGSQFRHGFDVEVAGRDHAAHVHHHGVQLAAAQLQDLQLYGSLGHRHPHAGLRGRSAHQRHHQQRSGARPQADIDQASAAFLQKFGAVAQLRSVANNMPRTRNNVLAQGCEFIALTNAIQHPGAQVLFQTLNAAAERRLGDEQLVRRTAKRAAVGKRQQVFQVLDVHGLPPGLSMIKMNDN